MKVDPSEAGGGPSSHPAKVATVGPQGACSAQGGSSASQRGRLSGVRRTSTRSTRWRRVATLVALTTLGVAVIASPGSGSGPVRAKPNERAGGRCGTGAPPEVVAEPEGWPLPNGDLANTRQAGASPIDSTTIGDLGEAWTYDVPGTAAFGNLTTNPVVIDGQVFTGALDGSIHVTDLDDGAEVWSVARNLNIFGPAGVAVGWGQVYGISDQATVVAHDAASGEVRWERDLEVAPGNQVDMSPTLVGGCVLVSTQALAPGSRGTLYALDHETGEVVWRFETVPDDFWGNPSINHGGGAWYPPAVDPDTGESWWGTSNPWPSPGAPGFPAGASRPGDNLYTNSALALDAGGDLRWHHQVFAHDIWDRDMVLTQLVELPEGGRVVTHTGKGGRVLGYDPDTGDVLWDTPVGLHRNDELTTFVDPTTVMPGVLGGVETPPAAADGTVYVAAVNAPSTYDSPEDTFNLSPQLGTHPSTLVALDAATGEIDWQTDVPGDALGGVTVVNDLLLTSTLGGLLLAYDRASGDEVWRLDVGVTVNGSPAVVGDTIVWPISGGDVSHLLALRLGATGPVDPEPPEGPPPGPTGPARPISTPARFTG